MNKTDRENINKGRALLYIQQCMAIAVETYADDEIELTEDDLKEWLLNKMLSELNNEE